MDIQTLQNRKMSNQKNRRSKDVNIRVTIHMDIDGEYRFTSKEMNDVELAAVFGIAKIFVEHIEDKLSEIELDEQVRRDLELTKDFNQYIATPTIENAMVKVYTELFGGEIDESVN